MTARRAAEADDRHRPLQLGGMALAPPGAFTSGLPTVCSDTHPSLGLESGTVRLASYDPAWPGLFAAEAARIAGTSAPLSIRLEHVGSTSVPGLAAKPILDILAGRPAGEPLAPYVAAVVRAGYEHRGEQGIPGREFFRRGTPRAYHVHLVEHARLRGAAEPGR